MRALRARDRQGREGRGQGGGGGGQLQQRRQVQRQEGPRVAPSRIQHSREEKNTHISAF